VLQKRTIAGAVFAAAGLFAASGAQAGTATGQFGVSIIIEDECKVQSAPDLDFGTEGVLDAAVTATTTLGVQCTENTAYSVTLSAGGGAGATTTTRRMSNGGSTVAYTLYRDAGRTQIWGTGADAQTGTGNGAVQNLIVYGRAPAQTTAPAGTYTDTIQITVTY
jgi:spore coat protein U-like protein